MKNFYLFKFISYLPFINIEKKTLQINLFWQNQKKQHIKNSYLIFVWINYLNKNKKKKSSFSLIRLPSKSYKFTTIKAPIAHKTWSKEQYSYKIYKFIIKSSFYQLENKVSIDDFLLLFLIFKNKFPHFETNLLFFKTFWILLKLDSNDYFNFNNFRISYSEIRMI